MVACPTQVAEGADVSKKDKAEFRAYCMACTDIQLRNVYNLETMARRAGHAMIALQVMNERGIRLN